MTGAELLAMAGISAASTPALFAALPAMSTVSSILGGVSALSSVMGGMEQQQAANQQSEYAMAEATMKGKESARQSVLAASNEKAESERVRRAQKLAYMSSGVSLEGSPLLVMEQTRRTGQANIDEILAAGGSASAASMTEGRVKADSLKSTGRQAFMSGLSNAGSTLFTAMSR